MTFSQLEYIIAIADSGSFSIAAGRCFVTQPTLSMQVKKLEDELGFSLFDRNRQPVTITKAGEEFINRARILIRDFRSLTEYAKSEKGEIKGELRIGVIPTLAPYLIPLFAGNFIRTYPKVTLSITEFTTAEIIQRIKNNTLDCGILATPLHEPALKEIPLFDEPFVAYLSAHHPLLKKNALTADDLNPDETWILNEGHCFRNQVMNFCQPRRRDGKHARLLYESGSLLTLKKMVDTEKGLTVLPELATREFSSRELKHTRYFKSPEPAREISIVTARLPVKTKLIDVLREAIVQIVPKRMKRGKVRVVEVN